MLPCQSDAKPSPCHAGMHEDDNALQNFHKIQKSQRERERERELDGCTEIARLLWLLINLILNQSLDLLSVPF